MSPRYNNNNNNNNTISALKQQYKIFMAKCSAGARIAPPYKIVYDRIYSIELEEKIYVYQKENGSGGVKDV